MSCLPCRVISGQGKGDWVGKEGRVMMRETEGWGAVDAAYTRTYTH